MSNADMKEMVTRKTSDDPNKRSIWRKPRFLLFLIIAVVVSVFFAFMIDQAAFRTGDNTETFIEDESAIYTGYEAIDFFGCEITDGKVVITGADPQFVVPSNGSTVSAVQILFREPVGRDIHFQLFYSLPGVYFSEEYSTTTTIAAGSPEKTIVIPENIYSNFRFDFEESVILDTILCGKGTQIIYSYRPHAVRVILLFLEIFIPLCLLAASLLSGRGTIEADRKALIRRKPFWTIILCNLFLFMTIGLFQPITEITIRWWNYPYMFSNIWWVQLLLMIALSLLISFLMLIFLSGIGRICASLSLGTGISYLAQALLWNDRKPLQMNTSWPMEMLNIFVWFGVIIITTAMVIMYSEKQRKTTERIMCGLAILLIAVQSMSFTVLGTIKGEEQQKAMVISRKEQYHLEKDVIDSSLSRGMPFFLKPKQ